MNPESAPLATSTDAQAERHLWRHFTRLAGYRHGEIPMIVRGKGCWVEDTHATSINRD